MNNICKLPSTFCGPPPPTIMVRDPGLRTEREHPFPTWVIQRTINEDTVSFVNPDVDNLTCRDLLVVGVKCPIEAMRQALGTPSAFWFAPLRLVEMSRYAVAWTGRVCDSISPAVERQTAEHTFSDMARFVRDPFMGYVSDVYRRRP